MWNSPRPEPIWGDGFCDDTFSEWARVGDWDALSADEYVLFFPRLGPKGGHVLPAPVLDHIRSSRARLRTSRLARDPAGRRAPSRGRRLIAWLPGSGLAAGSVVDPDDEILLRLLEGILAEDPSRFDMRYDRASAVRVAFGVGLNPAYLWTEAVAEPDAMLLAGWLGHLDRGRKVLVPSVLARFLSELTLDDVGHLGETVLRRIEAALRQGMLDAIRSAAGHKLQGRDMILRFPRRVPRRADLAQGLDLPRLRRPKAVAPLSAGGNPV